VAEAEAPLSSITASACPAVTCSPRLHEQAADVPVVWRRPSAGAELSLLVEPVVSSSPELELGSLIAATLPVTMCPTPPTVTVTSPRLAVAT
jgi:hypothetical protein